MNSSFPHPETGELLDSREDFLDALKDVEKRLGMLYITRNILSMERAERFDTAEQPEPRYRTVTQEKVARCPRCGGKLKDGDSDVGFGEAVEE